MAEHSLERPGEESALVLHIPEVEDLVGPYRLQWDPSAKLGVPAHVTLLYPFMPPSLIDAGQILKLGELFADFPSLDISFNEIRRWPEVLYLHPSPSAPVKALMGGIMDAYPIYPPYGRENLEAVPHLTVAQADHPHMLDEIGRLFNQAAVNVLPIQARVDEVTVMQKRGGSWRITHRFPLRKL